MNYKLTEHDSDVMATMLFMATRLAERAVEIMEQYHEETYMMTNDYKALVRKVGLIDARKILHDTNKRVIRNDERCKLNEWMKAAEALHKATERLTIASMDTSVLVDEKVDAFTMFDWIQEGAGIIGRLFVTFGNLNEDDIIKVESYAKVLQKHKNNDLGLLEYFRPKV